MEFFALDRAKCVCKPVWKYDLGRDHRESERNSFLLAQILKAFMLVGVAELEVVPFHADIHEVQIIPGKSR